MSRNDGSSLARTMSACGTCRLKPHAGLMSASKTRPTWPERLRWARNGRRALARKNDNIKCTPRCVSPASRARGRGQELTRFAADCSVSRTKRWAPALPGGRKRRGGRLALEVGAEPRTGNECGVLGRLDPRHDEANQCRASDRVGLGLPDIVIPPPPRDLRRFPRTTFGRR